MKQKSPNKTTRSSISHEQKPTLKAKVLLRLPKLYPYLIIAASAVAAFHPVFFNDFVNWDDDALIYNNPYLNPPSFGNLISIWLKPYENLYDPLTYTSYMLDLGMAGMRASTIHAMSLAYHIVAAWTALSILLVLGFGAWEALIGVLVFVLHPLQVETVAWAAERKGVLSGCLGLLALWQYILWSKNGHWARYAVAIGFFLLALFAKPSVVTLPLMAFAIEYYFGSLPLKKTMVNLAPWFVLAVLWSVLTAIVQPASQEFAALVPLWQRPFVAAYSLGFYIRKLVWPWDLTPVYGKLPWHVLDQPINYLWLPAAAAGIFILFRQRNRWAGAGMIFLASLLPVLGLQPFLFQKYSAVADRYAYLSLFGVAVGVASSLHWMRGRPNSPRICFIGLPVAVLCILGLLSNLQARQWRDSVTVWKRVLSLAPEFAEAQTNLGAAYLDAKPPDPDSAMAHFKRAIELNPADASAMKNLGRLLFERGNRTEAISMIKAAIAVRPKYADGYNDLGIACLRSGEIQEAVEQFRKAVELDSHLIQAHTNLAGAYRKLGRTEDARAQYREVLALDPANEAALRGMKELAGSMP